MSNEPYQDEPDMDLDQDQAPASIFPGPPPYWEFFTAANVKQLQRLRDEAGITEDPTPASDLAKAITMPAAAQDSRLDFLIPPPEPEDGVHWTFGEQRNKNPVIPSLEDEYPILHPDPPNPKELIRLSRAGLLSFLEFVHVLAVNPDPAEYGSRWENIRNIMINVYRALNVYRQWAAREALIAVLEARVKRAKEEVATIDELEQKVGEVMRKIQTDVKQSLGEQEGDKMEIDTTGTNGQVNGSGGVSEAEMPQNQEDLVTWDIVSAIEPEPED